MLKDLLFGSRTTSSSAERFDVSVVPACTEEKLSVCLCVSDFRIQCFSSSCDLQIFEVCGLDLSFDITLSSVYLIKIKTAGTGSQVFDPSFSYNDPSICS